MNSAQFATIAKKLPDSAGVYFFKKGKDILYIGRATSLRDRVKSYFANDLIQTRGPFLVDMVTQATTIDFEQTDSVLEAIILESNLIKKHQPYFNTKEKDDRSYNYVVITDEEFPRVMLVRSRTLDVLGEDAVNIKKKFGPYPQGGLLKEALIIVRKIFPYRDARATNPHNEAFYQSLGLSPDTSAPDAQKTYARTIRHIELFFEGHKKELVKTLTKEMKAYAKARQFEQASAVKRTLYALAHIQDVALIKSETNAKVAAGFAIDGERANTRIEAYDVAHLAGGDTVGVMTVLEDGELNKSQYRKFKLSRDKNDDAGNLREIITRRLAHPEWPMPAVVVVDGGEVQKNIAEELFTAHATHAAQAVPHIVSVVKDEHHKPREVLGLEKIGTTGAPNSNLQLQLAKQILLVNNEAHRFAITYHRLRRSKHIRSLT